MKRFSKGFSLIEVIIAMLLLGLISLCLTTAFSFAVMNTARTGARRQGMAVAETNIARVEGGTPRATSAIMGGRYFDIASAAGHSISAVEVLLGDGTTRVRVFGATTAIDVTEERGSSAQMLVFMPTTVDWGSP